MQVPPPPVHMRCPLLVQVRAARPRSCLGMGANLYSPYVQVFQDDSLVCGEPAISLHSHHVSLVQWTTHLLPVTRESGSNPLGVLMWNWDSPLSIVSLHWWPHHDWSLWPCLRRASSRTVTRPSCRQCDNPTWSHTAFLSQFHARCWSPFWLHNQRSWMMEGSPVESLQSHFIPTMSHWSSGLPVCFPSQGTRVQIPWGVLMWNRDSPVRIVSLQVLYYTAYWQCYTCSCVRGLCV
jgi:hypothetical protein